MLTSDKINSHTKNKINSHTKKKINSLTPNKKNSHTSGKINSHTTNKINRHTANKKKPHSANKKSNAANKTGKSYAHAFVRVGLRPSGQISLGQTRYKRWRLIYGTKSVTLFVKMFLEYLDKTNYHLHQERNLSLLVVPQLIVIAHRRRPRQLVLYPSRSFIGSVKMNGEMVLILLGKK